MIDGEHASTNRDLVSPHRVSHDDVIRGCQQGPRPSMLRHMGMKIDSSHAIEQQGYPAVSCVKHWNVSKPHETGFARLSPVLNVSSIFPISDQDV